jgi:uncharacterized phage protein (TIGR01671 family)
MRDILFRGKCKYRDGFVYGSHVVFPESKTQKILVWNRADLDFDAIVVIPETVGQFTGLTDRNGKNIFEGDIISVGIDKRLMYVQFNEETFTWVLTDVGASACEVDHFDNTFDLWVIQVESCYGDMISEVIGNIHDNPELLEKGKRNDRK